MLIYKTVLLRAFEARDIEFVAGLHNHREVEAASQPTPPMPVTRPVFTRRFEAGVQAVSSGGKGDIEWVICFADDPDRVAVGVAGLYCRDLVGQHAELGVVITPEAARRGLGLNTYVALTLFAFRDLNLRKIYGYVKANNEAAIGTCKRLGLTRDGVLPEHRWVDGEWIDLEIYSLLRRDWDDRYLDWDKLGT